MQVLVETKVTILDGDEKGREFTSKRIEETHTQFTDIGVVERVRIEWSHLHAMPKPVKVEEEKCCSDCVHSGIPAFMYPCNMCYEYNMFTKDEKKEEKTEGITEKTCETCKFNTLKADQFSRCEFCNNFSRYEEDKND